MKQYSENFKKRALLDLEKINRGESIKVKGTDIEITTVRGLCLALGGLSTQTIYKWREQKEAKDTFIKKELDKDTKKIKGSIDLGEIDLTEKGEIEIKIREFDTIKPLEFDYIKPSKTEKLIIKSEIRYYGSIASVLGIKNYSTLKLPQLKLKIGLKLIKLSNLIDFDKIYEKINGVK